MKITLTTTQQIQSEIEIPEGYYVKTEFGATELYAIRNNYGERVFAMANSLNFIHYYFDLNNNIWIQDLGKNFDKYQIIDSNAYVSIYQSLIDNLNKQIGGDNVGFN